MGHPPFISSPSKLCPTRAHHITLGQPFRYLYTSPQLFVIYCTNAFIFSHLWRLTSLFWPTATHVNLGWSTTYHPPLLASSISLEYPTGHLPLPFEFVHLVPPLAQLLPGLVVPLILDLIERLRSICISHILQPRVVLSLPTS
jgi:hypothetical protein